MDHFLHDLRAAARAMRKSPGFALVVVAALALGVGANSAMFSVLNAVVLRPLPYGEPERILVLSEQRKNGTFMEAMRLANLVDYRQRNRVFEALATFLPGAFSLVAGGEPERIKGARVSDDFFKALEVEASYGRGFTAEDGEPGAAPVVVLSHGLWQRRFGSDPALLGKTVIIDSIPHTVIGVTSPEFQFSLWGDQELWVPKVFTGPELSDREIFLWFVIGRLKPALTLEQVRADLDRVAHQLAQEHPEQNGGWSLRLTPIHEYVVGQVRPALLLLLGAVGFMLLVACSNVANLMLARNAERQSEIALRLSLGASRARLARQLLVESALLALLGGACGLFLASWGIRVIVALSPVNLPRTGQIGIDSRVLLFTFAVSLLTGLLVAVVPVLTASRLDFQRALREGGPKTTSSARLDRLHGAFVVLETALVLVLLIGAGLMVESLRSLRRVAPGFDTTNRIFFEIAVPPNKYTDARQVDDFYRRVLARVEAIPGVKEASGITNAPLSGDWWSTHFFVPGRPVVRSSERDYVGTEAVTPAYFRSLAIPLLRGRFFSDADDQSSSEVAIINESMARLAFPDQDPLGQVVSIDTPSGPWRRIVGVVADVRHRGLDVGSRAEVYIPHGHLLKVFLWHSLQVIVWAEGGDALQVVPAIRGAVREVDPAQSISEVSTYGELAGRSISRPRFLVVVLGIFAAVALFLGTLGIYGVVSFSTNRRLQEIGIRMALGARKQDILRLTVGRSLVPVLLGVTIGLGATLAFARVLSSFLFGVSAVDLTTYLGLSCLLVLVALGAAAVPALRAVRVHPVAALRAE